MVLEVDPGSVVRREGGADVQAPDAIASQQQPIGAARQDLAAQPRSLEAPARHIEDAPIARRDGPHLDGGLEIGAVAHQVFESGRGRAGHGMSPLRSLT
jgi:hypothetical protein